jgi:hypothetical protein
MTILVYTHVQNSNSRQYFSAVFFFNLRSKKEKKTGDVTLKITNDRRRHPCAIFMHQGYFTIMRK